MSPAYPHDAFIKKVEGTVVVEAIVDSSGRVVHVRVLRSVPLLDGAALECVSEWMFIPARHHGVAVPTVIRAPIEFRIY